ncbi:unnamed protein product [Notodromas monacha]|uniref:Major facilitator superfamily (MFS) profile domain-containing protein n=1 Tax=Notodromas monacha TaxID=399045 RepID=A0A7R9BE20_9CRUS|nr:unnamed protein product [Notodromas monacha]CAG0912734.1 unnamed protein product [Notodromas monacha]
MSSTKVDDRDVESNASVPFEKNAVVRNYSSCSMHTTALTESDKADERSVATSDAKPGQSFAAFDELLPHVGDFGRYQKLLIWLVCLPACIPCGFHAFNQLFMADVPDHWCRVPELEVSRSGLTDAVRKKLSIPIERKEASGDLVSDLWTQDDDPNDGTYSRCRMYDIDYNKLLRHVDFNNLTALPDASWPTIECSHGWIYDKSEIFSSIVIDFDLVCDKAMLPTVGLCVLNIGGIIGVYLFGVISDRFGRRISFFLCLGTELVAGIGTAWATNVVTWMLMRFIVGLTIPAIYQIPFIISIELVGPQYRGFVTVMTCLAYTLGLLMLSGVAYLIRDWVLLSYATALPFFLYCGYWWFLPESPRWLLAKGRLEEAAHVLRTLARVNGKVLPKQFYQELRERLLLQKMMAQQHREKEEPKAGFMDLFLTPNMRKKTLLVTFNWFANETAYVGLSYYGPAMGDNEYMSFFLSSLVEIPSYLACWFLMDVLGRRWPMSVAMMIGGVAAIFTVAIPEEEATMKLGLYLVAKFAIAASFLIIYPFAGELFPTEVRGIGIGFSAYVGGIGLCIIPFVNYLGRHMLVLPLIVMGVIAFLGGILGLALPETLRQKLPQTIAEGEEFGKDQKLLTCTLPKKASDLNLGRYGSVNSGKNRLSMRHTTNIMLPPLASAATNAETMKLGSYPKEDDMETNLSDVPFDNSLKDTVLTADGDGSECGPSRISVHLLPGDDIAAAAEKSRKVSFMTNKHPPRVDTVSTSMTGSLDRQTPGAQPSPKFLKSFLFRQSTVELPTDPCTGVIHMTHWY